MVDASGDGCAGGYNPFASCAVFLVSPSLADDTGAGVALAREAGSAAAKEIGDEAGVNETGFVESYRDFWRARHAACSE